MTLQEVGYAAQTAVFVAFFTWLMDEDHLFSFYRKWLNKIAHEWPDWLSWINKPLGGCDRCFSGQCGFWAAVILGLGPFEIVFFTAFTLFFNELRWSIFNFLSKG